jgi:putative N6-adenine-specific DNA methylase
MVWPGYDAALWQRLITAAEAARSAGPFPVILGSDRDAGAVEAARANAARAGVGHIASFEQRAISALAAPPGPGWVVTNPPYGPRLGGQRRAAGKGPDLRNLYAQFGKVLRAQCPGWQVACLTGDARLAHATGLAFDAARTVHLVSGGLAVQLAQGTVR